MQKLQRYSLLLGLIWYVSVLAYSQIFIYGGTRADLELEQLSTSGKDLGLINVMALVPFLFAVYVINFNYVLVAYNSILANGRLLILYVTILAVTIFHAFYVRDIKNIQYSFLLLISIPAFSLIWNRFSNDISSVFAALSISLIGYLVAVPLVFGAPDYRYYGTIHPNTYGGVALAAAACISLSKNKYLRIGQLVTLAGAISVDSRFATLGIIVIIGAEQIASAMVTGRRAWGPWVRLGLLAVLAISFAPSEINIFSTDDSERGLAGGISGRTELWELAIEYIITDPLGYGFKSSFGVESGHNGFLNLAIQFGLVPAILIVSTFIRYMWNLLNELRAERTTRHAGAPKASPTLAMNLLICFLALLAGGFFQPQLINFGDPIGVLFLLILSRSESARKNVENAGSSNFLMRGRRPRGVLTG